MRVDVNFKNAVIKLAQKELITIREATTLISERWRKRGNWDL